MSEYTRIKPGRLYNETNITKFNINNLSRKKFLRHWYLIVNRSIPMKYKRCCYVQVKTVDLPNIMLLLHSDWR